MTGLLASALAAGMLGAVAMAAHADSPQSGVTPFPMASTSGGESPDGTGNRGSGTGDGNADGSGDARSAPGSAGPASRSPSASPSASRPSGGRSSGGKSSNSGSVPGPAADPGTPVACDPNALIQALVQANANSGGTLALARDCTYILTANQDGVGLPPIRKSITINGNNATLLRAADAPAFRILDVNSGGSLTLRDVTVTGGYDLSALPAGAGVYVRSGATGTLVHTTITGNTTLTRGGGVYNEGTTSLTDSVISHNNAFLGGGVASISSLTVENTKLADNSARSQGGGVWVAGGATLSNSTLDHNRSGDQGAGLYAQSARDQVLVSHSLVRNNTTMAEGGGIGNGGLLTVRDSEVSGNGATRNGGGISNTSVLLLENSKVTGNSTWANGGGLANSSSSAAAILRGSELTDNNASSPNSRGGGIVNTGGKVTLESTRVSGNLAVARPGGVFTDNGAVTVDGQSILIANLPNNCGGSGGTVLNCFG